MDMVKQYQDRINHLLHDSFPGSNQLLHQAMRYSILSPGKRLRPLLVYGAGLAVNAPLEKLDNAAIAVECIHAYSLIHDDLPAMDNDDVRRGLPTCHKKFDEATAILAGDALQSFAFEVLVKNNDIQQIILLAQSIGKDGMGLGQALDMQYKNKTLSKDALYEMYNLKTGKLIRASVELGMLCGSAYSEDFIKYAEIFGLAFQLRDDVLDQENNISKQEASKLFQDAKDSLNKLNNTELLLNIVESLSENYSA